ncbi:MAG: hypothetical protein E3J24_06355 [Dehalococcoidia bacterium]|nr:MAG: hypothetical protein E3J24_06355 [Dehalococcoidia bacterium]
MIDSHPAGWVLGARRVMEDSAKALYDSYPDGEKSDFFAAYVYLKYIDHFIHHALVACGLRPVAQGACGGAGGRHRRDA